MSVADDLQLRHRVEQLRREPFTFHAPSQELAQQAPDQPQFCRLRGAGMEFEHYLTPGHAGVEAGHLEALREHFVGILDDLALLLGGDLA